LVVVEREIMEVDTLFVGGGIASLSSAIHLASLIKKYKNNFHTAQNKKNLDQITIAVLEKGSSSGAHALSGAVIDISPLKELIPDIFQMNAPLGECVTKESLFLLGKNTHIKSPFIPSFLRNEGNYIVSLSRLNEWLAGIAQKYGVDIFTGFAATEALYKDNKITGVRTGDKGIDADGNKKTNFEPGIDLHAKITALGEGSRGSITKTVIDRLNLDKDKNPQHHVIGIKEVWELPENGFRPGEIIQTAGYPLEGKTYGGGFIYGMADNLLSIGLVIGLDYQDPFLDPYLKFQQFKTHPFIAGLLKNGKLIQYGAKTTPVGGYYSIPELAFDNGLIIGDSANLFIGQKHKGIHSAVKSGMLAAEAIFHALLKKDFSRAQLYNYQSALYKSSVGKELYHSRNWHQIFREGLHRAILTGGFKYLIANKVFKSRIISDPDFSSMKKVPDLSHSDSLPKGNTDELKYDNRLTFKKDTALYYSGTTHEEDQPAHLRILDKNICRNRCTVEYQNPCTRFCPGNVYERIAGQGTEEVDIEVTSSNCLHCKTCDIKDPYNNILWTPPEGGGGPVYTVM